MKENWSLYSVGAVHSPEFAAAGCSLAMRGIAVVVENIVAVGTHLLNSAGLAGAG